MTNLGFNYEYIIYLYKHIVIIVKTHGIFLGMNYTQHKWPLNNIQTCLLHFYAYKFERCLTTKVQLAMKQDDVHSQPHPFMGPPLIRMVHPSWYKYWSHWSSSIPMTAPGMWKVELLHCFYYRTVMANKPRWNPETRGNGYCKKYRRLKSSHDLSIKKDECYILFITLSTAVAILVSHIVDPIAEQTTQLY